jgi:surfeit locus 1 family protein
VSFAGEGDRHSAQSRAVPFLWCGVALAVAVGLIALGIWQLQRRVWKLDLISQIEQRVNLAPIDLPGPDAWSSMDAPRLAYCHVQVEGVWLSDRDTLVQAVTDFGGGYWVMTPLRTKAGFIVLVNRGFIPMDARSDKSSYRPAASRAEITGLLRMPEPRGGFLRANAPSTDRWYSRDVQAIAQARGLENVAPYFVDAAATSTDRMPVAGLTVLNQSNNHLVYAITWFSLAAVSLYAGFLAVCSSMATACRCGRGGRRLRIRARLCAAFFGGVPEVDHRLNAHELRGHERWSQGGSIASRTTSEILPRRTLSRDYFGH